MSGYPAVYLPWARLKYPGPSPQVISSQTGLVIDGYTRSATTFAVHAFQLSQEQPVRLAHHLHASAQLLTAARRGVPALALIREPRGAILSQLIREPKKELRDALAAYSRFYIRLLPYRGSFVVGEFKEVTHDFGAVIRRLNAHFGTSFAEFVHTETNMRECFDLIKLRGTGSPTLLGFESGTVSRDQLRRELPALARRPMLDAEEAWIPSGNRERAKAALDEQWRRPSLARLRDRAAQAYQEFLAG
ncbi:MAG: hypothetical protein JO132_07760 [Streptosporangiaceae bacterium]|nr:hypothetical protein [Streptosporangiaceae bacterium]